MEAKDTFKEKFKNDKYLCRAKIAPVVDEGVDYDFEAVAVPAENGQLRYSYSSDEFYNEILRTGEENIEPARLESGLPLFDNHPWENSAANTLGITTGYSFDERGLVVRVKLGARADEALRSDIKNGILKTVSIEGFIHDVLIERKEGQIPVYYAERWEPISLSIAPVPNDIGAQVEVKRALEKQIKRSTEKPQNDSFINKLMKKF